jgi:hypothetical protein
MFKTTEPNCFFVILVWGIGAEASIKNINYPAQSKFSGKVDRSFPLKFGNRLTQVRSMPLNCFPNFPRRVPWLHRQPVFSLF